MLNPEYVDKADNGMVEIGFSDNEGNVAVKILITKTDAGSLHKMLLKRVQIMNNWPPRPPENQQRGCGI